MMANSGSTIALKADPNDPEDGDVTEEAVEQALAERRARLRGRPAMAPEERKQKVTMRLSPETAAALRATGPGWQRRADEALRKAFAGG